MMHARPARFALSLMLFFACLGSFASQSEDAPAHFVSGTVTAEGARLREQPSRASNELVRMGFGTVLTLTELVAGKTEEWYQASLTYRGKTYEGFVPCRYVRADGPLLDERGESVYPALPVRVSAETLNRGDNRVGHNWHTEIYVNGQKLTGARTLSLRPGDEVLIQAVITENDSRPDTGEAETRLSFTEEDLKKGFDAALDVYVTENAGRYSGYTCHWTITFYFRPAG